MKPPRSPMEHRCSTSPGIAADESLRGTRGIRRRDVVVRAHLQVHARDRAERPEVLAARGVQHRHAQLGGCFGPVRHWSFGRAKARTRPASPAPCRRGRREIVLDKKLEAAADCLVLLVLHLDRRLGQAALLQAFGEQAPRSRPPRARGGPCLPRYHPVESRARRPASRMSSSRRSPGTVMDTVPPRRRQAEDELREAADGGGVVSIRRARASGPHG